MSAPSIKQRAREELRNYAIVAGYLYVCFAALLLYKDALLQEQGLSLLPHGIAAAKALILGKFILLGEAAGVGKVHGHSFAETLAEYERHSALEMLAKCLLLLLVLVPLIAFREFVGVMGPGALRGKAD